MKNKLKAIFKFSFLISWFLIIFTLTVPEKIFAQGIIIVPEPIFNVNNFSPGNVATSTVTILNNSGKNYELITLRGERIFPKTLPDLSEMIELSIENEGKVVKINLSELLEGREIELPNSQLPKRSEKLFHLSASFNENAGNEYQLKSVNFNLIFTFLGDEKREILILGIGQRRESEELIIFEESISQPEIGENFVTIIWETNFPASSQIIYSRYDEPHTLDFNAPNFGYTRSTPEYDIPPSINGVRLHRVTIADLEPATTYYFRCVSRGSLAISKEHVFTTKGISSTTFIPPTLPPPLSVPEETPPLTPPSPQPEIFSPVPERIGFPAPFEKKENIGTLFLASLANAWQKLLGGQIMNNWLSLVFLFILGIIFCALSLTKGPRIIFGTLGLLGTLALFLSSLFLPLPFVEQLRFQIPKWISIFLGLLFLGIGLVIIIMSLRALKLKTGSGIEKPKQVVNWGIYSILRHPFYSGVLLIYLGGTILFNSLSAVFFFPVAVLLLLGLAILEEKDLIKMYGLFYKEYQKKTPWRLIPFIL